MEEPPATRPRAHDSKDMSAYTLDVAAAATQLGRSENTVRRLIRAGDLPAMQVQGTRSLEYRLREADVCEALGRLDALAPSHSRAHGRVGTSGEGKPHPSANAVSTAAAGVAGVQALIEQATAPLIAANRRLQDANERLTDQLMGQAEELGRLRERLHAAEVVDEAQPEEGLLGTPMSAARRFDDRSALWDELAAHVQPAPAMPQPAPEPPTRRSLIQRLLRR